MSAARIPISPLDAAQKLAEISKSLGLIDALKQKLVRRPDGAADALAAVMEELQKSLLTFDAEVTNFLAVSLEPGADLRADVATLASLEGAALKARLQTAHTRCAKIGAIYDRYLSPWFQRVTGLNGTDRGRLEQLFLRLRGIDGDLIAMLDPAAQWLADRAKATLDAYDAGDVDAARKIVAAARGEILPTRRALADALVQMRGLEAHFIEAAAIV